MHFQSLVKKIIQKLKFFNFIKFFNFQKVFLKGYLEKLTNFIQNIFSKFETLCLLEKEKLESSISELKSLDLEIARESETSISKQNNLNTVKSGPSSF